MKDQQRDSSSEEIRLLREENERLRVNAAVDREIAAYEAQNGNEGKGGASQVFNIKQVNESCVGSCFGLIAVLVVVVAVLGQCAG